MVTIKPKWVNTPGLIKVSDLPIGKFGSINGNIVYRIEAPTQNNMTWLPGLLFVEKHNHLTIYDGMREDTNVGAGWSHMCELIEHPDKKHCDGAIAMIRKLAKDNKIDGLSYVDHLSTLKQYIKDYLKAKADANSL